MNIQCGFTSGAIASRELGPVRNPLVENVFAIQTSESIGTKLLMLMGWKPGQGIGARRRLQVSDTSFDLSKIPKTALSKDGFITVAPKEVSNIPIPEPKSNLKGVGYISRNDDDEVDLNLYRQQLQNKRYEDIDSNSMCNRGPKRFHMSDVITLQGQEFAYDSEDEIFGSSIPLNPEEVLHSERIESIDRLSKYVSRSKSSLPMFCVSKLPTLVPTFYIIELPTNYVPTRHKFNNDAIDFEKTAQTTTTTSQTTAAKRTHLSSTTRGEMIEDIPADDEKKVPLAFLNQTQRDFIQESIAKSKSRPSLVSENNLKANFASLSQAFKNRFVTSSSNISTINSDTTVLGLVSVDEYAKKMQLPNEHQESTASINSKPMQLSVSSLPSKFSIKPVRTTSVWAPEKLLCKRFNIRVPEISESKPFLPTKASESYESKIYEENIGKHIESVVLSQEKSVSEESSVTQINEEEMYTLPPKPPASLFKSIFEEMSDCSDKEDEFTEEDISKLIQQEVLVANIIADAVKPIREDINSQLETRATVNETEVEHETKILYRKPTSSSTTIKNRFSNKKQTNNIKPMLSFLERDSDNESNDINVIDKVKTADESSQMLESCPKNNISESLLNLENLDSDSSVSEDTRDILSFPRSELEISGIDKFKKDKQKHKHKHKDKKSKKEKKDKKDKKSK